jgi:diacylglycerol kinase family enzyme
MSPAKTSPTVGQRTLALISLFALGLLVIYAALAMFDNLAALALGACGLAVTVGGLWWLITEHMPRRAVGIVGIVLGLGIIVIAIIWGSGGGAGLAALLTTILVLVALGAVATVAARLALLATLHHDAEHGRAFAPSRPVLIYNEKSGGGKVGTFGLVDLARELGAETVALTPGVDLAQLARDAVARGADCLAMAGGDGSQALVASIAVETGVPFVCIPAGTRNHFALDLGLDRDDPRGAMYALRQGLLRTVDYATVGDRLFVNNVSFGAYATIVQSDDYRDAKLATTTALLPDLVGRSVEPFDLQFITPEGDEIDDAFVILVSNNPYVVGLSLQSAQRPSITDGTLGVVAARARTGVDAVAVLAEATFNLGHRDLIQFTAQEFEVRSTSGSAYAGIDGEALDLPTPARFTIHPRGLSVVMPPRGMGRAKARRQKVDVRALFAIALGRPPEDS